MMSCPPKKIDTINTALAELEAQINSCEQALLRFIKEEKMNSENSINSMSTHKINRKLHATPIAIIGIASSMPEWETLRDYWRNIVNKIDCITDVPSSHWSVEDYYESLIPEHQKIKPIVNVVVLFLKLILTRWNLAFLPAF